MNRRMMLMSTQEKIATALAAMKVRVRFNSPAGPMIDVVNKVMRLPPTCSSFSTRSSCASRCA